MNLLAGGGLSKAEVFTPMPIATSSPLVDFGSKAPVMVSKWAWVGANWWWILLIILVIGIVWYLLGRKKVGK